MWRGEKICMRMSKKARAVFSLDAANQAWSDQAWSQKALPGRPPAQPEGALGMLCCAVLCCADVLWVIQLNKDASDEEKQTKRIGEKGQTVTQPPPPSVRSQGENRGPTGQRTVYGVKSTWCPMGQGGQKRKEGRGRERTWTCKG